MTDILYREDGSQIVQLSAEYHPTWNASIEMVTATYGPEVVELTRMNDNKKPKKFMMSDEEADAFAASWLAYRAEMKAAEEAEQKRLQAVIDEAYTITKEHPAIKIDERPGYGANGNMAWDVSIPEIAFTHLNYSYHPDRLIEQVKNALEVLQAHKELEKEKEVAHPTHTHN